MVTPPAEAAKWQPRRGEGSSWRCRLGAQHICHHGAAADVPPQALLRHTVGWGIVLCHRTPCSSAVSRHMLTLPTVACRSNKTKKVKTPGETLLGPDTAVTDIHFAGFVHMHRAAC